MSSPVLTVILLCIVFSLASFWLGYFIPDLINMTRKISDLVSKSDTETL